MEGYIKNESALPVEIIEKVKSNSLTQIEEKYRNEIEKLKKPSSWKRYFVFGGISIGLILLASLVANQIISGSIAIVVALIAGTLTWYGVKLIKKMDPVIQKKINNMKIKLLIEEAQKQTIETITNYVVALDEYLKYVRKLRNKVDAMLRDYKEKFASVTDDYLKKEYAQMIEKLSKVSDAISVIEKKSEEKKDEFEKKLKIAKEKYEFTKKTKDIVAFLETNNDNTLDNLLVDTSLKTIEFEFNELTIAVENLARDIR
jgi:hypothetical protein